jgi:hypothetical protein
MAAWWWSCWPALPAELAGRPLQPVELRLQPAAVDAEWQQLITAVAGQCHTSVFRTLKSALPAGWLGQRRQAGGPSGTASASGWCGPAPWQPSFLPG